MELGYNINRYKPLHQGFIVFGICGSYKGFTPVVQRPTPASPIQPLPLACGTVSAGEPAATNVARADVKKLWHTARHAWFINRNPVSCVQQIYPWIQQRLRDVSELPLETLEAELFELTAWACMHAGKPDWAEPVFVASKRWYGAGYAALLQQNEHQAAMYWHRYAEQHPNHWGLCLLGFIQRKPTIAPTFLQVRNHLEADIKHLFQAQAWTYLENLLCYMDYLSQINPEVYKLIGRSLMHAGQLVQAQYLLIKGQKTLPNDPEIYFHLGQAYQACCNYKDSLLMVKQCLMMNPGYYPASELKQRLEQSLAS